MKRTLFMHIPKTAGTSVLVYLRQVYAAQPRLELRGQDHSLQTVKADAVANAANIWLHEPLRHLPGDISGFFKFTFLRDPIQRIGSLYAYLRDSRVIDRQDFTHIPPHVVTSLRSISRMSFKDFILSDDPLHRGHIANVYANYFAAERRETFASQEEYIQHCLKRMDQCFDLVGETSRLAEDMSLIRQHCFPQYKYTFMPERVNESNKQGVDLRLSSDMEERLEVALALDLALFRKSHLSRHDKRAALEKSGWRRLFGANRFWRPARPASIHGAGDNHGGARVS